MSAISCRDEFDVARNEVAQLATLKELELQQLNIQGNKSVMQTGASAVAVDNTDNGSDKKKSERDFNQIVLDQILNNPIYQPENAMSALGEQIEALKNKKEKVEREQNDVRERVDSVTLYRDLLANGTFDPNNPDHASLQETVFEENPEMQEMTKDERITALEGTLEELKETYQRLEEEKQALDQEISIRKEAMMEIATISPDDPEAALKTKAILESKEIAIEGEINQMDAFTHLQEQINQKTDTATTSERRLNELVDIDEKVEQYMKKFSEFLDGKVEKEEMTKLTEDLSGEARDIITQSSPEMKETMDSFGENEFETSRTEQNNAPQNEGIKYDQMSCG